MKQPVVRFECEACHGAGESRDMNTLPEKWELLGLGEGGDPDIARVVPPRVLGTVQLCDACIGRVRGFVQGHDRSLVRSDEEKALRLLLTLRGALKAAHAQLTEDYGGDTGETLRLVNQGLSAIEAALQ